MLIVPPPQPIDLTVLPVWAATTIAVTYFIGFLAALAIFGYLLWSLA